MLDIKSIFKIYLKNLKFFKNILGYKQTFILQNIKKQILKP